MEYLFYVITSAAVSLFIYFNFILFNPIVQHVWLVDDISIYKSQGNLLRVLGASAFFGAHFIPELNKGTYV